jgi:biotin/methionine sulfoxide reductase
MAARERMIAASHKIAEPFEDSLTDFEIFSKLSERFNAVKTFAQDRNEEQWLRHLYDIAAKRAGEKGLQAPSFDAFWQDGLVTFPEPAQPHILFEEFRQDPETHPLATPSGRIEIYSERIAEFGYDDCPPRPTWLAPREWLGSEQAKRFPLHLLSNQPKTRLHSQYDNGAHARSSKVNGREPIRLHPEDAAKRGISDGDVVRVFNDRGQCLAGAVLSDALRPGVAQLATGAWYDPLDAAQSNTLDKHGNPNVLTADRGTSRLSQGSSAQSCLVQVERFDAPPPPITAFTPPEIVRLPGTARPGAGT